MKHVAVIGGGVFGSTAAIYAARAGHRVHLFEQAPALLQAASGINQFRLHRGYHYPRSPDTARSAAESERSFRTEYGDAVFDDGRHLYGIARERSKVAPEAYLSFCEEIGLEYTRVDNDDAVDWRNVALLIEAKEARYDPARLRELIQQKIADAGVQVHLRSKASPAMLDEYDSIIVAAYAHTNTVTKLFTDAQEEYQFEVCEKPVIRLPAAFGKTDLVIMDGPFMCVDPYGSTGTFVLGHVEHAIHATNTGLEPVVPEAIAPLLNHGLIERPPQSRIAAFLEDGARFIPVLKQAEYVGSLFTVRTVLPRLDATDARPTLVSALNERVIKIFSGKVGNCVDAAQKAVALL